MSDGAKGDGRKRWASRAIGLLAAGGAGAALDHGIREYSTDKPHSQPPARVRNVYEEQLAEDNLWVKRIQENGQLSSSARQYLISRIDDAIKQADGLELDLSAGELSELHARVEESLLGAEAKEKYLSAIDAMRKAYEAAGVKSLPELLQPLKEDIRDQIDPADRLAKIKNILKTADDVLAVPEVIDMADFIDGNFSSDSYIARGQLNLLMNSIRFIERALQPPQQEMTP